MRECCVRSDSPHVKAEFLAASFVGTESSKFSISPLLWSFLVQTSDGTFLGTQFGRRTEQWVVVRRRYVLVAYLVTVVLSYKITEVNSPSKNCNDGVK